MMMTRSVRREVRELQRGCLKFGTRKDGYSANGRSTPPQWSMRGAGCCSPDFQVPAELVRTQPTLFKGQSLSELLDNHTVGK